MRILGVDYGTVRIGLALSDPLGIFAQPLETVAGRDIPSAAGEIARIAVKREVGLIVVGLPRNMDGSLGPKALEARAFGAVLAERTGLPVEEWDERLSTASASRSLRQSDMSRKKRSKRVDMVAAHVILQGYLDNRNRPARPPSPQE